MATFEALRRYIKDNYVVDKDQPGLIKLVFNVGDRRSQMVFVSRMSLGEQEWAEISTPVCTHTQIDPRDALVRNGKMVVGGLAIEGDHVMFRHSLPLADLDIDECEVPLHLVANYGDKLERELTGTDTF